MNPVNHFGGLTLIDRVDTEGLNSRIKLLNHASVVLNPVSDIARKKWCKAAKFVATVRPIIQKECIAEKSIYNAYS